MSTPQEQLEEYEAQLAEVKELIAADPNDESLTKLKLDLEELIAITKADRNDESAVNSDLPLPEIKNSQNFPETTETPAEGSYDEDPSIIIAKYPANNQSGSDGNDTTSKKPPDEQTTGTSTNTKTEKKKPPKSSTKPAPASKFEIPDHLLPLDTDTEGERNRKRRTIKALKSKWRERVKEAAGAERQKSWQSFITKGSKKRGTKRGVAKSDSIFRTEEGVHARVGVIGSGRGMTEFGERKRYKHL
mmetsp:Transcript_44450/g.53775  ORF Transcript_44450/g.53775 Transcript_44450/m.53775 type:complete len:246 (+) Transcript_44450:104-841(+)|eukprot:CAMPEP_0172495778 /NCGR_PEP_ID=MMETSP1066-20121228/76704_1 /TAXON_ID=671091 /ORGANISM="Coscinodiscus wailesii, Strain CCMP2513" /LENGTH=245 /DNA_ID=CAMNT_0013267685 /DNA_START=96 /DNA_END=833 /DNA_ORIENTATION=-